MNYFSSLHVNQIQIPLVKANISTIQYDEGSRIFSTKFFNATLARSYALRMRIINRGKLFFTRSTAKYIGSKPFYKGQIFEVALSYSAFIGDLEYKQIKKDSQKYSEYILVPGADYFWDFFMNRSTIGINLPSIYFNFSPDKNLNLGIRFQI